MFFSASDMGCCFREFTFGPVTFQCLRCPTRHTLFGIPGHCIKQGYVAIFLIDAHSAFCAAYVLRPSAFSLTKPTARKQIRGPRGILLQLAEVDTHPIQVFAPVDGVTSVFHAV